MSGTYTPSQTWHNTGDYVLTGEVLSETVSRDLGSNAMDNVLTLCGTDAGSTPQQVRKLATVTGVANLQAIAAADRRDADVVYVIGAGYYRFDAASATAASSPYCVAPAAGTGRWFLMTRLPYIILAGQDLGPTQVNGATDLAPVWEDDTVGGTGYSYSTAADAVNRQGLMPLHGLQPGDTITGLTLECDRTAGTMAASIFVRAPGSSAFLCGATVNAGAGLQTDASGVVAHVVAAGENFAVLMEAQNSAASGDIKLVNIVVEYTPR